jgi:hypothetical protein
MWNSKSPANIDVPVDLTACSGRDFKVLILAAIQQNFVNAPAAMQADV